MQHFARTQKSPSQALLGSRRGLFGLTLSLSAAALLGMSSFAAAKPAKSKPKEIVTAFYDMAFTKGQVREAALKYISPTTYIQHNPRVADGRDAFITALDGVLKSSGMRAEIKRVIAEGDLVVVHARWAVPGKADSKASAVMDIFRVKDSQIVEHWDAVQQVPDSAANSNTMF